VPPDSSAHLDFGCHDGKFLNSLKIKGIRQLIGIDISLDATRKANEQFPNLQIIHIDKTIPLPFADTTFTSITALDVIEHIDDQAALLNEFNRVLADKGTLVITAPRKHLFSLLDMGNFKLRLPRLHKWYYCRKHSIEEYNYRYVSNPDGLVGDVSAEKYWHEHFTAAKLGKMLNDSGFTVICFDGTGFFNRIINNANHFLRRIKPLQPVIRKISDFDARLFESANLFCLAMK